MSSLERRLLVKTIMSPLKSLNRFAFITLWDSKNDISTPPPVALPLPSCPYMKLPSCLSMKACPIDPAVPRGGNSVTLNIFLECPC